MREMSKINSFRVKRMNFNGLYESITNNVSMISTQPLDITDQNYYKWVRNPSYFSV